MRDELTYRPPRDILGAAQWIWLEEQLCEDKNEPLLYILGTGS